MAGVIEELATPFLAVEVDVLDRNVAALAARARDAQVSVRPHAKTHKCVEIARRQLEVGAVGLSVATLAEAEVFAAAGFEDLFIAYPLWAGGPRAARLRALAGSVSLRIGVDSADGARGLAHALAGAPAQVLVELDSGMGRTGVAPQHAAAVARAAVAEGLDVAGVFTFPGHAYRPGGPPAAGADEAAALGAGAAALESAGVQCQSAAAARRRPSPRVNPARRARPSCDPGSTFSTTPNSSSWAAAGGTTSP